MSWQKYLGNPLGNPNVRYELKGSDAIFRLREYLTPGGRYPYEDLPKDMSAAFRAGLNVYLYSVPGFLMVTASHYGKTKKPWCVGHAYGWHKKCFATAREAIRG